MIMGKQIYKSSEEKLAVKRLASRLYYYKNKEKILNRYKTEYPEIRKEKLEKSKIYYLNNKIDILLKNKIYNNQNTEIKNEYAKKYRENNKNKINEYAKNYRKNNAELIKAKQNTKLKNDVLYKLKHNTRTLIRNSFKNKNLNKNSKTYQILGCSFEEFKSHLESKFELWMNWDNRGLYNGELNYGWDIDHITPLDSAITEEDVIRLNHYTNLQPLCSKVNRDIKRSK